MAMNSDKYTMSILPLQFNALRSYLESGGCVLVMMTEGGEMKHNTNINFLLEELGVMANSGESQIPGIEPQISYSEDATQEYITVKREEEACTTYII